MGPLANVPIAQLAIIVGIVSAVAWVVIPGTAAIVVSLIAGALVALRAVSGSASPDDD
jgi:hypothetical protein